MLACFRSLSNCKELITDAKLITIRIPVRLWNGIDGGMDNRATNSMREYWNIAGYIGDEAHPDVGPSSNFARAIREEGWRQLPDAWQRRHDGEVHVQLAHRQWEFILADASVEHLAHN